MSNKSLSTAQNIAIAKINNNIALTPWQKECEIVIITRYHTGFSANESAELLRSVYEMKHNLESLTHRIDDSYSQLLIDKANDLITTLLNHPY